MKDVDDLNSAGEVIVGDVPDPFGAISDHDLLLRALPAAIPGFQIESRAELTRRFDGGDVSRRVRIADGVALLVPRGLGKNAADLGLASVRRLSLHFAGAPFGFGFSDRNAGTIHLHIEDGNGLAHHDGQVQLQGALYLPLYVRPLWPSPRYRPAVRSAVARDRMALPRPPAPACGGHLATDPFSLCPEQHRQDTARYGSADTDTMRAATRPRPQRSARAAHASPGKRPGDRRDKAPRARPGREERPAATGSTRTLQLDAWQPAWPSQQPPGRGCRSCA